MTNFLDIEKTSIPYRQNVRIENETFGFTINYNEEGNFFTIDLYRGNELLVTGEKLVYGKSLFSTYADTRFPKAAIIPGDLTQQSEEVTWETLGESVFLFIITEADFNV